MKKYLFSFLLLLIAVVSMITITPVNATVGGPTLIYDFKYNPVDESVYYVRISENGRGCPPELMKISLNTGKSETAFSCSQGEELIKSVKDQNIYDPIYVEINKITKDFKPLTVINLKDNNISIDINFVNSENYSPEIDLVLKNDFTASVYQNNKKIIDLPISGCNAKQPFVFAGYAIPGFDKKIILLLSAKNDCWEGGYIYETLHVIGGVDNLNKNPRFNFYKSSEPLIPNEETLVVFEADKTDNTKSVDTVNDSNKNTDKNLYVYIVIAVMSSLVVGILIGFLASKLSLKKS